MWFSGFFFLIFCHCWSVPMMKITGLIFLSGRTCTIGGWLNTFLHHCIFNVRDKIEAMIKKLELFSVCNNKDNTQVFPSLYDFFVSKWSQAYGQYQMWGASLYEWVVCAITQVLSQNRWQKLDSLSLSCPASSPLTDIWTREPHQNCNKRLCEKIISSEPSVRFLDWAALRVSWLGKSHC